jgi:SpoVK/Ycf46/Vps4 family AAA+-type ATPase
MGEAEKLVRKLYQVASEFAPSILFLDEMDALLSSRKSDGGEHEASRRLKTEFMVQMDGISTNDNEGSGRRVLLIACTNCPWDVDSAVLRRFPRRIYVPLPDSEARRALIENLLKKSGKHSLTTRQISTLVNRTNGFTCSDISSIASEAAFGPLRSLGGLDAIRHCTAADVRPIQLIDFESVIQDTTKSVTGAQLQRYEQWQKQQAAS